MTLLEAMTDRLGRLGAFAELDVEASALPASAVKLSTDSIVLLLAEVAALVNDAHLLQSVLAGVAAQQSRRENGHSGLAGIHGHATPTAMIQSITGGTRADAARQVRVGTALLEAEAARIGGHPASGVDVPDDSPDSSQEKLPWHEPLRRALLDGRLTTEQQDAIRNGLGEPMRQGGEIGTEAADAWSLAAEGFIAEAASMTVEELAKRARIMRDMLDPMGAEERFARRFEKRSFQMWVDDEGQHRARITFDDEMGIWVRSMRDAALRPRRGGPRFVTDDERAAAAELADDPRSNEQLHYDLLMDVIRAGSLASTKDVLGARQPGVRMVVVMDAVGPRDAFGRLLALGHAEDGGDALPGSVIDRNLCAVGPVRITVDQSGNPLDLGREQSLYSASQRIGLATRDGGCLWPGCQRSSSYCEAHHCDHFVEHEGRTDIDRGVPLCRFHHMLLHNNGWRITREGKGPFMLHPPPGAGAPIVLASKAAWKWAWDPPPPPERAGWRGA